MSKNTQDGEPISAADFAAILSTTLAMAAEAGLSVGVRSRAATGDRPAGLLIYVSGLTVTENGQLVVDAPALPVEV